MAFCSKCGKELEEDAQFCPSCGTPVNGNTAEKDKTNSSEAAKEKAKLAADKAKEGAAKLKTAIDKLPFNNLARKYADYANYAVCVIGILLLIGIISTITPNKKTEKSKPVKTAVEKTAKESKKNSSKGGKGKAEKAAPGLELVTVPAAEFAMTEGTWILNCDVDDNKINHPKDVSIPEFKIASTETSYEQWYEVFKWATDEARGDKRYRFANSGREGSGKGGKNDRENGAAPTARKNEPVTCVYYNTIIVWCNALSEKAGLEPVYYLDDTVIRDEKKLNESLRYSYDKAAKDYKQKKADSSYAEELWRRTDFARFKIDSTKNGYRLPTRAEWYLAAKGGKPGSYDWDFEFSGSDTASEVGWFRGECGYQDNIKELNEYLDEYGTKPVAKKKANSLGLYDMSGNVWEWTNDPYITVSIIGDLYVKVARVGGSWKQGDSALGKSISDGTNEYYLSGRLDLEDAIGFRVARNAK